MKKCILITLFLVFSICMTASAEIRLQTYDTSTGRSSAPDNAQIGSDVSISGDLTARDAYLGGNAMFVDYSTGNVGVGMYTPGHKFGIQSTLSAEPKLLLQNNNADAQAPGIIFRHFSASPADDDNVGRITFDGYDSGGTNTTYVRMDATSPTVADGNESGLFRLYLVHDDGSPAINSFMEMTGKTGVAETVFNQDSKDIDFRVESDNDTGALFVQGSDGNVGIGTTAPGALLYLDGASTTHGLYLRQTGVLASSNYGLLVNSNVAQTNSPLVFIDAQNAGGDEPAIRIQHVGNVKSTEGVTYIYNGGTGRALTLESAGNGSHMRFITGVTPTSPQNGDLWMDSTGDLVLRVGGANYTLDKSLSS